MGHVVQHLGHTSSVFVDTSREEKFILYETPFHFVIESFWKMIFMLFKNPASSNFNFIVTRSAFWRLLLGWRKQNIFLSFLYLQYSRSLSLSCPWNALGFAVFLKVSVQLKNTYIIDSISKGWIKILSSSGSVSKPTRTHRPFF